MCRIRSSPILLIYLILIIENCFTDDKGQNESEFIPTHEWQVVRKGQAIPKGLHVRMNFETGVTEAKLIDDEHSQRTDLSLSEMKPEAVGEEEQSNDLLETDVIEKALRKIKSDEASKETNNKVNKFRSYEQLKEEIASLNLTTKIDGEIMNDLFAKHDKETAKKEVDGGAIVKILEDFDFLVHQFDNGLEFVRQNGFERVIYKNLNSSIDEIRKNTLKLFGSLVQNNGKVQIHALETGSIPIILRILNLETNTQVKSSSVFSLSCLLRRFPLAQLHFIENGGLSVVAKLLRDDPIKIQTKVVTLMNDLLLENIHAREDTSTERKMLNDQYKYLNLEKLLLENDWCNHLNSLMISVLATASSDHDSIEKCLISMKTLAGQCNNHFDEDVLIKMLNNYKSLVDDERKMSESDGGDNFFDNIHGLCVDILNSRKNIKTEL